MTQFRPFGHGPIQSSTELDALIERLGITITGQSCLAVDLNEQATAEQMSLIERVPGGQFKSEPVKLHDVKHRLLVERPRGDGARQFSNAGFWFLTRDSVLIPYGRRDLPYPEALPFAVSMNAWAHIVRSFTPRTEDYDRTLVACSTHRQSVRRAWSPTASSPTSSGGSI